MYKKSKNTISVVIVNYNSKEWINKCLTSLLNQTYKNLEIIVVDNASKDKSVKYINENYPTVKLIKNSKNLGFARGNNVGIKKAKGKYILLINIDTWINKNLIENLFSKLLETQTDVIAPIEISYQGKTLKASNNRTIDLLGHPYFEIHNSKEFYLQGICLLFKKKFYLDTKGLDDNFFMYFEETDWFWRLNLLNKQYFMDKSQVVYHKGSAIAKSGIKYNNFLWRNENCLQMLLKNYSLPTLILILPFYFIQNLIEILFFLIILKPHISFTYIKGWMFNLKNIKTILKKRDWIQKHRKINDIEIIIKMHFGFGKLNHLLNYFIKK